MKSYKELIVWQKAVDLCVIIYRLTRIFPKEELYGLVSQMRRSAIAIPSNIAEGQHRGHTLEYIQFLRIAFASSAELETQLLLSLKIGYINEEQYVSTNSELQEIMRMLNKLINTLVTRT